MSAFAQAMNEHGYCFIDGLIPDAFLERLRFDLERAIEGEAKYHRSRNYPDFGMVLLCAL